MKNEKISSLQRDNPCVAVYLQQEDSEWYQRACSHQSCQSAALASFWPLSWLSWTGFPWDSHTICKFVECKNSISHYSFSQVFTFSFSYIKVTLPVGLIQLHFCFGGEHRIHVIIFICRQVWGINVWSDKSPLHGRNLNNGVKFIYNSQSLKRGTQANKDRLWCSSFLKIFCNSLLWHQCMEAPFRKMIEKKATITIIIMCYIEPRELLPSRQ